MKFEPVKISKRKKVLWEVLGFISFPITIPFFYTQFFERELYLNRRLLWQRLQEGNIKEIPITINYLTRAEWDIDSYKLILWKEKDKVSLHSNSDCIICDFKSGYFDRKNYNKIKSYLLSKIESEVEEK